MEDDIKIIPPEYLSWDIEKLRKEYFKIRLLYSAERLSRLDDQQKINDVDNFISLLTKLTKDEY